MCRDTLWLILRKIEKEGLGIVIKSLYKAKIKWKVAVAFIDNKDLALVKSLAKQKI